MIFILAMLEWKSNQLEVLVGFSEDVLFLFYQVQAAEILFILFIVQQWQTNGTGFHLF